MHTQQGTIRGIQQLLTHFRNVPIVGAYGGGQWTWDMQSHSQHAVCHVSCILLVCDLKGEKPL